MGGSGDSGKPHSAKPPWRRGEAAARAECGSKPTRPAWLERELSLPFDRLAPGEFEVFSYLLLLREHPNDDITYYGKVRDGGIDILHRGPAGTTLVQCKRYSENVGVTETRAELRKLVEGVVAGRIPRSVGRVVFYAARDLTSEAIALLKAFEADPIGSLRTVIGAGATEDARSLMSVWRPCFSHVPGAVLSTRARRHSQLIDDFFAVRKVVDNSEVSHLSAIVEELCAKLDRLVERGDTRYAGLDLRELVDVLHLSRVRLPAALGGAEHDILSLFLTYRALFEQRRVLLADPPHLNVLPNFLFLAVGPVLERYGLVERRNGAFMRPLPWEQFELTKEGRTFLARMDLAMKRLGK